MQLKQGHDGLARVTLVRTAHAEFTRPVSKLRRLPVKDNDLHKANVERHAHKDEQHEQQRNFVQWYSG